MTSTSIPQGNQRARSAVRKLLLPLALLAVAVWYWSPLALYLKTIGLAGLYFTMLAFSIELKDTPAKQVEANAKIFGMCGIALNLMFAFGFYALEPISTTSLSTWTFSPCSYQMAKNALSQNDPLTRSDLWAMNSACKNLETKALLNMTVEAQREVLTGGK